TVTWATAAVPTAAQKSTRRFMGPPSAHCTGGDRRRTVRVVGFGCQQTAERPAQRARHSSDFAQRGRCAIRATPKGRQMRTKSLLSMVAVLCAAIGVPGIAHASCKEVLAALGNTVVDVTCAPSADLTTKNPTTTPADNSIPGLPPGAFTPTTDRTVISPDPPNRTPITKAAAGIQLNGRFAVDPTKEARILLRLPDDWKRRLGGP